MKGDKRYEHLGKPDGDCGRIVRRRRGELRLVSGADLGRMGLEGLIGDFEQTLRRTDKVQPALVIVAIVSGGGFALSAEGSAGVLASVGAAGFVVMLGASVGFVVPLQRRMVASGSAEAKVEELRALVWGNLGRTMLGAASFVAVAAAATL